MHTHSLQSNSLPLGLSLLSGADSFINDLNPEEEASITGGRRGSRRRGRNAARRSFLRTLRSRRRSRRNRRLSLQRDRISRLISLQNPFD
jgi:hypothetical protein